MHESERHRIILSAIEGRPVVTVADLVTLTGSSEATIRRDIAALHVQRGEYAEALAALQTALRNRPDYGTALENLGLVHLLLARQSYTLALRVMPDSDAVARQLARLQDTTAAGTATSAPRGNP